MSKRVKNVPAKATGHRVERKRAASEGQPGDIVIDYSKIIDCPNGQWTRSNFLVAVDAADGTLLASRVVPEQSWDASEFLREVATLWPVHGTPRTIFVDHGSEWMTDAVSRASSDLGFELRSMRLDYRSPMVAKVERAFRNADAFRTDQRAHEILSR